MMLVNLKSAGGDSSAPAPAGFGASIAPLPVRDGSVTLGRVIDMYMLVYKGRDRTRYQRVGVWHSKLGHLRLDQLDDDHVHVVLRDLAAQRGRYYSGKDADGKPIYKAKVKPLAPATINRFAASLSAVLSWAIRERIAPKGWINPCSTIRSLPEDNARVRFLSDDELPRLLEACKRSRWDRLYLLVLMALTTGARRGELEGLHWRDVDLDAAIASVGRTKNGDPRRLPLLPAVVGELHRHEGPPDALIFASKRRPDRPYSHEYVWHKALAEARVRDFRLHDNRHTCASILAMNGATLLEIADVLGHRNTSVTKRYSHLTVGHKTALVNRVLGGIK